MDGNGLSLRGLTSRLQATLWFQLVPPPKVARQCRLCMDRCTGRFYAYTK
jgi:hypothetical protein